MMVCPANFFKGFDTLLFQTNKVKEYRRMHVCFKRKISTKDCKQGFN